MGAHERGTLSPPGRAPCLIGAPRQPAVKLDQFLKFQGLVATGGEAKLRIQRGDVRVNGAIETRRGRQLALGDAVTIDGCELLVSTLQAAP